ncbi:unnamed protein product [Durusdinium trenchii]|uniref:Transmembrane protein n=1 Tax=Durusdinium trenchii TaxID=1381693 RepID=A0ABP0NKC2_9DINO
MVRSPHLWICAITLPALAMVIDISKAHLLNEFYPDRAALVVEQLMLKTKEDEVDVEQPIVRSLPLRSRLVTRRLSSYDFAHPGGPPRHLRDFVNPHPTAGDLSLIESGERSHGSQAFETGRTLGNSITRALEESHSEEDSQSEAGPLNLPDGSGFAQQKIPHIQVEWNACKVISAAGGVGVMLFALSMLLSQLGQQAVEVSIHYSLERHSSVPFAEAGRKVLPAPCQAEVCTLELLVPEDMPAPIHVMYHLDPFYQNYPNYIQSGSRKGAWPQLTGKILSGDELRKHCPVTATRESAHGSFFPCGLQAGSFFNDTFKLRRAKDLKELFINESSVAREDDLKRMRNPPGYPHGEDMEWLFMRYPEVISLAEGVKNQRFAEWMRPSALPSVLKRIGQLDEPLSKGETILVEIGLRFPASTIDVEKELVLLSPSPIGGSSHALSRFLLYASASCWVLALIVLLCEKCCKRPLGHPRFERMRIAQDSESSESDGAV